MDENVRKRTSTYENGQKHKKITSDILNITCHIQKHKKTNENVRKRANTYENVQKRMKTYKNERKHLKTEKKNIYKRTKTYESI